MDLSENTLHAFRDELDKIAGTGLSRVGIRPRTATTMAAKKSYAPSGIKRFVKKNFMNKFSAMRFGPKHIAGATAAGVGLGLIGERKAKKALQDWQTGRAIRQQQEGR
jgi:hypothetical protein